MGLEQDHELVAQIKNGDLSAYERLFRGKYSPLVNFANQLVDSREVSEEIVQDVFVYLWQKRATITIKTSLTNYLFTAVKNKCFTHLKLERPKMRLHTSLENIELEAPATPDAAVGQTIIRIKRAIDDLPEKCREIFVLSRNAGLTYREIAEELDLSIKTVEKQMNIALKKLKAVLK